MTVLIRALVPFVAFLVWGSYAGAQAYLPYEQSGLQRTLTLLADETGAETSLALPDDCGRVHDDAENLTKANSDEPHATAWKEAQVICRIDALAKSHPLGPETDFFTGTDLGAAELGILPYTVNCVAVDREDGFEECIDRAMAKPCVNVFGLSVTDPWSYGRICQMRGGRFASRIMPRENHISCFPPSPQSDDIPITRLHLSGWALSDINRDGIMDALVLVEAKQMARGEKVAVVALTRKRADGPYLPLPIPDM